VEVDQLSVYPGEPPVALPAKIPSHTLLQEMGVMLTVGAKGFGWRRFTVKFWPHGEPLSLIFRVYKPAQSPAKVPVVEVSVRVEEVSKKV
jgi:hypothetical protein